MTAAIHADGHDVLAASLWVSPCGLRPGDRAHSGASDLRFCGGVARSRHGAARRRRVVGELTSVGGLGCAEYTIAARVDAFASWRCGLAGEGASRHGRIERLLEGGPAPRCGHDDPHVAISCASAPRFSRAIPNGDRELAALDPLARRRGVSRRRPQRGRSMTTCCGCSWIASGPGHTGRA